MKNIYLANNKGIAKIDNEDFSRISKLKWHIDGCGYAVWGRYIREKGKKSIFTGKYMHREVMNAPKDKLVDHINGDRLDNRKKNLRLCTHRQNIAYRPAPKNNTSGYKGVSFRKREGKYEASITKHKGIKISLGFFDDPVEAAKAWNKAAKIYHGEFAYLNKIKTCYHQNINK